MIGRPSHPGTLRTWLNAALLSPVEQTHCLYRPNDRRTVFVSLPLERNAAGLLLGY